MKDIAVIIPTYKAHDTILNTLRSIAIQRQVSYKVYLVIDGKEGGEYEYLLEHFKDIDIKILKYQKNGGPGKARQYGIDHSKEPFISFIDADDTYLTALSLFYQQIIFKTRNDCAVVSTIFWQEQINSSIKVHEGDMTWMHGKMYRRAYLDKYDIRFNDSRANEDVGFNTQCQCYTNENEQLIPTLDPTYLWQWRDDSIVRSDNQAYKYGEGVSGFVDNKIYAIKRALEKKELDDRINLLLVSGMVFMFNKYERVKEDMPKKMKFVLTQAQRYYNELYTLANKETVEDIEKKLARELDLKDSKGYDSFKEKLKQ